MTWIFVSVPGDGMQESPATRASCWFACVMEAMRACRIRRLYAPVIYGFARKRACKMRMRGFDAGVLRSVRWRPALDTNRPRPFAAAFTVTRQSIYSTASACCGHRADAEQVSSEEDLAGDWEADYQRTVAAQAMERSRGVSGGDWNAFLQTGRWRSCTSARAVLSVALFTSQEPRDRRLRQEIEQLQETSGVRHE